jgi:muconolactone delta-isomerase
MEFLVTTITQVPAAMPDEESPPPAKTPQLRRLWRAPLPDDDTRMVSLFDVDDTAELDKVLAAMPKRAWRTDDVTPLSGHPDDPPTVGISPTPGKGPESLVTMTLMAPPDTPAQEVADAASRQSTRLRELARRGNVVRVWALPDQPDGPAVLGLWRARDPGDLMATLESLPMTGWMTIEITPLSPHRDDPVRG